MRRDKLYQILEKAEEPVSGGSLAKELDVSRQVIVQDIALLRANGAMIYSTNRGYFLSPGRRHSRVFKVYHTDEETEEELNMIVDLGGQIDDVFIYHKVYGTIRAKMGLKSRRDIRRYMDELTGGKSHFLKNITSNYHYHTVSAESEEILDIIQEHLSKRGFLAKLVDYEPVDFWGETQETKNDPSR